MGTLCSNPAHTSTLSSIFDNIPIGQKPLIWPTVHWRHCRHVSTRVPAPVRLHSPLCQQVEDLLGGGEGAIGGEEDVDVGGLELPRVAGQGLHQLLQGARLHEPHPDGLPLEVGDVVLLVVIDGPGGGVVANLLQVDRVDAALHLLLAP